MLNDPRRDAGLAGLPWLEVGGSVDAASGERREHPGRRVHDFDRDVVVGDQAAEAIGDALEHGSPVERREDRLRDLQQLALAAELALERRRLLTQPLRGVGVGHRLRGEARVDDEQTQVVVAELVQPELGEHQHPEHLVIEEHRREQHRFVEVVLGAGDRVRARVRRGIREVLGDPLLGDPAGDALADRDAELVGRLVDVLADLPLHRDRHEVGALDPVHADVVEVDELAKLGGDGDADVMDVREVVEARSELLDRLQLRGPGGHLLEVLGGPDGDAGLRREGRDGLELVGRPGVRRVVVDVQQSEQVGAVHEGRRAEGVVALLHDRGARIRTTRVVAIVHREEGSACRDGRDRQRSALGRPHQIEVAARKVAAHLGHVGAVRAAHEDRRAVGFEQDHGVIDEAGEDPVEIEPAPDVARDAAQGLGPMQEMRDLFLPTRDPDDGPDRIGEGRGQLRIGAAEPVPAIPAVRDHQQDTPGAVGARDGHRKLAEGTGQDRRRHPVEARAEHGHGTGRRLVIGPGSRGRYRIERPPEDAEGSRQIQQTRRDLAGGHGRGSRCQAVATQLPEGDERQLGRGADLLRDPHQVVIEVAADDRQARDVVEQGEVAAVALRAKGVHAIGPGRVARDRRAGEMSAGVSRRSPDRDAGGRQRCHRGRRSRRFPRPRGTAGGLRGDSADRLER